MAVTSAERRVREIFEEAVELAAFEQASFFEKACGSDSDLRERVEALLEAHQASLTFLPDIPPEMQGVNLQLEQPGDLIGRYKLVEKIGEGGCGVVYLAEQQEPVRRKVALKVIKLGMDTRAVVARFEAERQALALMEHPNIAQVFDAGATQIGRPFFVMELVQGLRLTEHCERHRISTRGRLALFLNVCRAIQHAHQKGIIHRDIKPSNILVAMVDGCPVPKVIDFGIAKATDVRLTDKTLFTQFQGFLGTPAYMSPEQAELSGSNLDTRTDIYSLGVLLYELLTGETPFDANALLQLGLDELRRTIREVRPPRPSTRLSARQDPGRRPGRDLRSMAARVRGELDWIVMKCLEKDPSRRYDTASGLAEDLERYLRNEAVIARPPSKAYLFKKLVQRNRGAFAALTTIVLLLVAGITVSSWQTARAQKAERRERELRQQAQRSEQQAKDAREEARLRAYTSDMKSASSAIEASNFRQAQDLLRHYFPQSGEPDLRGLEWRYLWQASHGDESQSFPQNHFVTCVRLSPARRLLAIQTFVGMIRVVEVDTGHLVATFPGIREHDTIDNLAFSPDGKVLAVGTSTGLTLRDTATWREVNRVPVVCEAMCMSTDGKALAALNDSGVHLYNVNDLQEIGLLPSKGSGEGRLAYINKRDSLAVLRRDSAEVEIWDLSHKEQVASLPSPGFPVGLAASHDGHWLATGNLEGEMRIWNLETKSLVAQTKAHARWLHCLTFSPDDEVLASGGGDQIIHFWETSSFEGPELKKQDTLKGHRNEIWSLDFSADGSYLASGGKDSLVKLWNVHRPPDNSTFVHQFADEMALGFMPEPKQFLLLAEGGTKLRINDATKNRIIRQFEVHPHGAIIFQSSWALFGTTNGTAEAWSLANTNLVRSLKLTEGPLSVIAASADQKLVLGWDRIPDHIVLWDWETGGLIAEFPDFATAEAGPSWSKAQRVAFSPDNHWLAYASSNYTVKVWDSVQRKEASILTGHAWHIQCLRFSHDGKQLATGSWDSEVRLWNVETGREIMPPLGHLNGIGSLSFSHDGRTLAVRSSDNVLHFWSTANGAEMLTVPRVTAWFFNMISADGNALAWEPGPNANRIRIQYLPTLAEIDARERKEQGSLLPLPILK